MKTILFAAAALAAVPTRQAFAEPPFPDAAGLDAMAARFAPADLRVDLSGLSAGDRRALAKLIEASRLLNPLFMRQIWSGNLALYERLKQDETPLGKARLNYFWINKGPWSSLDGHSAFLPGVPARKPPSAEFYPQDMTREEFEAWAQGLPEAGREQARGFFTVIRRDPGGKLAAVPYSREYASDLGPIAALLREASEATDSPSLRKFLSLRAQALLSNDYFESDAAWMDIDAPIEVTFGPYETYNDELLGYKAAYESYVALRDDRETSRLAALSKNRQEIENGLPIPEKYRNPSLGATAPIRVVNLILSSGDGAHGVHTAAYNLPNDDKVVAQKGSKQVMLKNVQEAKFRSVLSPIASRVLSKEQLGDLSFDSFFSHILAHEICHGLGPHQIQAGGGKSTVREELKDVYSAIEEAKADAMGLFAMRRLIDDADRLGLREVVGGDSARRSLYATFLASSFRALRFGVHEAHGRGMALQLNYLLARRAFRVGKDGTFSVDHALVADAVSDLVRELLLLEAKGDYAGAKAMLEKMGGLRPEVSAALDRLSDIPVDISPRYLSADSN
jgi:hypothetical protein